MKINTNELFGSVNDYGLGLLEENYNALHYKDYLKHKDFHHSDKGCEVEITRGMVDNGNIFINKFCKTHNTICSKTGWKLGFYMGTESIKLEDEPIIRNIKCKMCGSEVKNAKMNQKYCSKCQDIIYRTHRVRSIECALCGAKVRSTKGNQKYCLECQEKVYKAHGKLYRIK